MAEDKNNSPPPIKKRRLSLSLKRKGKTNEQKDRFARLSEIEREECKKKPGCKNTDKSQLWAFCVFEAWIENQCGSEPDDNQIRYKESDLYAENAKRVCSMLCKFIAEARIMCVFVLLQDCCLLLLLSY